MAFVGNGEKHEKIPLPVQKYRSDAGAMSESSSRLASAALSEMKNDEEEKAEKMPSGEDPEPGPMSLCRKFVMFLSFHIWIFYFAFILVILPCRQECGNGSSSNIGNCSVTSNTTVAEEGHPEVVTFRQRSDIVCETENFSLWAMHLDLTPRGCRCGTVYVDKHRNFKCIFTGKANGTVLKTSQGSDSREQLENSTARIVLTDCQWKEMCLILPHTQAFQTCDVVIEEENTEIIFRGLIFLCNEPTMTNVISKEIPRFTFSCSYS